MDAETTTTAGDTPTAPDSAAVAMAAELAAKHGAGESTAEPNPEPGRRGRRSVAEESAEYLRKNGLVAVPIDSLPDSGRPADSAPCAEQQAKAPEQVLSPEFVGESIEVLINGLAEMRRGVVYRRAFAVCKDKVLAEQLASEAGPPPGSVGVMRDSLVNIARKYNISFGSAPEVLLGFGLVTWIKADSSLEKRLVELEKAAGLYAPAKS